MANGLNSLILEGVVIGKPHKVEASQVLNFTIGYERFYKNKLGEDVEEKSQFKVVVYGRMCKLPLKDGVGVRIVGRLKQNKWKVQIVAEHIEIEKD